MVGGWGAGGGRGGGSTGQVALLPSLGCNSEVYTCQNDPKGRAKGSMWKWGRDGWVVARGLLELRWLQPGLLVPHQDQRFLHWGNREIASLCKRRFIDSAEREKIV